MTSENNRKSFRQQVESGIGQHKRAISSEKVKKAEEERKERALDLEVPRLINQAAEMLEESGVAPKPLIEYEEFKRISQGYDKPSRFTYLASRRIGKGWILDIYGEDSNGKDESISGNNGLSLIIDKNRTYAFCHEHRTMGTLAPSQSKGFFKLRPAEVNTRKNPMSIIWDHQLLQTAPNDEVEIIESTYNKIQLSSVPVKQQNRSYSTPFLSMENPSAADEETIYLTWATAVRDRGLRNIPLERALAMAVGRRIHEEQKKSS